MSRLGKAREIVFTLKLSQQEADWLVQLARRDNRTMANYARQLICLAARDAGLVETTTKAAD